MELSRALDNKVDIFLLQQISRTASPVDENMMGSAQQTDKPYKPKFHKAVLYNEQQQLAQPAVELRVSRNVLPQNSANVPQQPVPVVSNSSLWRGNEMLVNAQLVQPQMQVPTSQSVPGSSIVADENVRPGLHQVPPTGISSGVGSSTSSIPPRLAQLVSTIGMSKLRRSPC